MKISKKDARMWFEFFAALPEEELLEKVRGMNRRRQFQMPKDPKAV